jgi:hypothetical protein
MRWNPLGVLTDISRTMREDELRRMQEVTERLDLVEADFVRLVGERRKEERPKGKPNGHE